jgi:putative membrane protein
MTAALIGLLGNAYLWVKAGHIIFVIFWMAGLFMMPRFFVYHQESTPGSAEDRLWVEREARLLRIILKPSLIVVWVFGLALALDTGAFAQGWFHLKFLVVLGLSGYHGWMVGYARRLAAGDRRLSGKTLRILNEVPGIAAVLIVVLAIVKPF